MTRNTAENIARQVTQERWETQVAAAEASIEKLRHRFRRERRFLRHIEGSFRRSTREALGLTLDNDERGVRATFRHNGHSGEIRPVHAWSDPEETFLVIIIDTYHDDKRIGWDDCLYDAIIAALAAAPEPPTFYDSSWHSPPTLNVTSATIIGSKG